MTQHKRDPETIALETLLAFLREVTSRRLNHEPTDVASLTEATPTRDRPKFRLLHGGGKAVVVGIGLAEVARQIRDRWVTIGTTVIAAGAATATIAYAVLETPISRPAAPGAAGPTAAPFVAGPTPTPEAHTIVPPPTSPPAPTATPTTPATTTPDPPLTTIVVTEPTTTTPADVPVTETSTTTPPSSPPPTRRRPQPHPKPTVTPTVKPTDSSESKNDGTPPPPPSNGMPPPGGHHDCTGIRLPVLSVCVTLGGGGNG